MFIAGTGQMGGIPSGPREGHRLFAGASITEGLGQLRWPNVVALLGHLGKPFRIYFWTTDSARERSDWVPVG